MMRHSDGFDLSRFLPYLLNQAAEETSRSFAGIYRDEFGISRTQWRVMANLGRFGPMTARDICRISLIEKTKVSRAVSGLVTRSYLRKDPSEHDRRAEILSLTGEGAEVYGALGARALAFEKALCLRLGPDRAEEMRVLLRLLCAAPDPALRG